VQTTLPITESEAPSEPLDVQVSSMSRDGEIGIGSNQEMVVPPFDDFTSASSRRQLLKLSEVDVSRDLFDITFGSDSDVEYSLKLEDWSSTDIKVKADFSDPLALSQGKFADTMKIKIKNPKFFVSAATGESYDESKITNPMKP